MNVVIDVWGGELHLNFLARTILPMSDALQWAEQELKAGYLVNMRTDLAWGPDQAFDHRQELKQ